MQIFNNTNDLVYAIAQRVKVLANEPIGVLRKTAESQLGYTTRGELIEELIIGEFVEEFTKEIQR